MNLNETYRPQSLDDVSGRDSIVEAIKNEYKAGTMRQSYLFIGHYGTGKTTVARIIAKMLNGYTIEVDAASNNTSEDIETLIEQVKQKPIGYDNTVLILDEIQNCGTKALSKLLIFLEKLPKFLTVIMCTTDGDKVLPTIKSRCECFTFSPIALGDITNRLKYICEQEHFEYEVKALIELAKISDGSMRMAVSNLQKLAPKITLETVKPIAECSYDNYLNLIYNVSDKNISSIITIANRMTNAMKFTEGFFAFVLDCAIYNKTKDPNLVTIPKEYLQDIEQFTNVDVKHVGSLAEKLLNLLTQVQKSTIMKELLVGTLLSEVDNL